jgi:exodeoxyribonuclease V gamma subunit
VVVSELLDTLDISPIKHPLHGFSQAYFAPIGTLSNGLRTYKTEASRIAQAFAQSQRFQRAPRWWQDVINAQQSAETQQPGLLIDELIRFARDPQMYFMQTVMGIRFDEIQAQQTASEPFALDALENYNLNQRLLKAKLTGDAQLDQLTSRLHQSGEWLSGTFGQIKLKQQLTDLAPIAELVQNTLNQIGEEQPAYWLSLDLAKEQLQGWLKHHAKGQVYFRYAQLKPKDYVQAWLWHLTSDLPTWLIGLENKNPVAHQFTPLAESDRLAQLNAWSALYKNGLSQPSPLIIEAAWAYVSAKKPEKAEEEARNQINEKVAGRKDWVTKTTHPPKPEMALLYQGMSVNELYSDEFLELTEQLIQPIWQALNASNTAEETHNDSF